MRKNIFKFFAVIVTASMLFVGCQKDEDLSEQDDYSNNLKQQDEVQIVRSATIFKYDSVYIVNQDIITGDVFYIKHRTIKIRNLNWTKIQEWFLDDLQTNTIEDYSFFPGDTDGSLHGYYYPWFQIASSADANDWQYLIYRDALGVPIIGEQFHLPKNTTSTSTGDLDKLVSMLGTKWAIRAKLQLGFDGAANNFPSFDTRYANIWMEYRGTPFAQNIQPGCGVFQFWDSQTGQCMPAFTNIETLKANVRLVRNITQAQW